MNTEETLQKTPLFKNIKREDVKDVIGALGAKERSYAAGENILRKAFPPVPFLRKRTLYETTCRLP